VFKNTSPTHPSSRVKTNQESGVRSAENGSSHGEVNENSGSLPETGGHGENGTAVWIVRNVPPVCEVKHPAVWMEPPHYRGVLNRGSRHVKSWPPARSNVSRTDEDSIFRSGRIIAQALWRISHTIVQVSARLAGSPAQISRLEERLAQRQPNILPNNSTGSHIMFGKFVPTRSPHQSLYVKRRRWEWSASEARWVSYDRRRVWRPVKDMLVSS